MQIIILGPPGSGKGTQAKLVSDLYYIPAISMGAELRKIAAKDTTLGRMVKKTIDDGKLVPDHVTIDILKKRLKSKECKKGYILDGFPRDLNQAKLLKKITEVDHVFYLHATIPILLRRLSSRKQCKKCNAIFSAEAKEKKCSKCGGELYQRDDDRHSAIKTRLKVFRKNTLPVIKFYSNQKKLNYLNGDEGVYEVFHRIKKILG